MSAEETPHNWCSDISEKLKYVKVTRAVLAHPDLSSSEKLLLAEAIALDRENGCTARNAHFAAILNVRADSVSRLIKGLADRGLLQIDLKKVEGRGTFRTIKVAPSVGINAKPRSALMPNPLGTNADPRSALRPNQESNREEDRKEFVSDKDGSENFDEQAQHPLPLSARPLSFAQAFGSCFEIAAFRVVEYDPRNAALNVGHYVRRAANWSASKGATSLDWAAQISTFIENDRIADKLQKRDSIASPPPLFEAVAVASQNLAKPPFADFRRRLAFLADNYAHAVAAGFTAADPARAAQMLADLAADPDKAADYFQKRQKP